MKKQAALLFTFALYFWAFSFTSCSEAGNKIVFEGNAGKWISSGSVSSSDGLVTFSGSGAQAVLSKGGYKNFSARIELQTTNGGKGYFWLHTDKDLSKGYRVAINNDREDPVWWKMSGSIVAVRNLTKSFVRENNWFAMDIKVDGRKITVSINGNPVAEYAEPVQVYRTAENKSQLLSEGTLAIESVGRGDIIVRSVNIEALPDNSEQAAAVDESRDDIIRLHQEDFPVLDYHVHLKGGLTKEDAAVLSRRTGINYALAPNCGIGFPITNDAEVLAFLDTMRTEPFILAMQAEGREWIETFSQSVRDEFDYVFTDALTFSDHKNRRTRLWIPEETWIDNEEAYMDMIVDRICMVLQEPMDIYVNPCFLPEQMNDRYDHFWTEARMNRFVDAIAKSGKALEINNRYRIPSKAIIMKAKAAGVKFTFGTNNGAADLGMMEYAIQMKKECGITAADMYKPKIKI
jgi:hypothetical protein